ncbi:MAG: HNH endonuclease [Bacteroidales bacterium]|nr:HNH endonuclease [Bacteroidales bacterium]
MIKLTRKHCPNPTALVADYKNKENKTALKESSFDKCIYCESKISHIEYGDVEHIKPKGKYPQLKFTWTNLGFACEICNRKYKHEKYDEATPYINPFDEDPSEHIIANGAFLFQNQGSERGELTIIDIGLNRSGLIEKRQERINDINNTIKACFRTQNPTLRQNALDALKVEANSDKEYSFTVKALLNNQGIV